VFGGCAWGISPRREALFWAKEYLAQARVPRLSENSRNDLMFCLTRRLGKRFEFWEKGGLAQASKARPSESWKVVLCEVLA